VKRDAKAASDCFGGGHGRAGSPAQQVLTDSFANDMRDRLASGLKWPTVAAAVALIAAALLFSLLPLKNAAPPSQDVREVKPVDQIAPELPTAQPLRIDLDLREYVPSGKETKSRRQPLALPRRRLYVTIAFPTGFGPGTYEIQVLDAERRPRASASGLAAFRDGSAMLQTTLDLISLPLGAYQLAVRRQSEDWHLYPAQVQ
jgi:hypothetical protein